MYSTFSLRWLKNWRTTAGGKWRQTGWKHIFFRRRMFVMAVCHQCIMQQVYLYGEVRVKWLHVLEKTRHISTRSAGESRRSFSYGLSWHDVLGGTMHSRDDTMHDIRFRATTQDKTRQLDDNHFLSNKTLQMHLNGFIICIQNVLW